MQGFYEIPRTDQSIDRTDEWLPEAGVGGEGMRSDCLVGTGLTGAEENVLE